MQSTIVLTAALAVVCATAAAGQTIITSPQDHAKVMKSNAEIGGAMNKVLSSDPPSYADARTFLAAARLNFLALQRFWTARKQIEAIAILKDGVSRIEALDKMLSSNADLTAIQLASQEFGRNTCGACHKLFREGDEQSGFRFKPQVP